MVPVWINAARPKTLPAAAAPVFIACAHASHEGVFSFAPAGICLLFALLIQIGTNFANDYYDGVRGTDSGQRLGPTRAVAAGLIRPPVMFAATCLTLVMAFFVGLLLVAYGGWWLVAVGLLCVFLAFAYTGGPFPLAYLGLGDLFVLCFFGLVPVMLTYYVQAGAFSAATFWTGLGCGLLANNLLVVNNYRDAEGDARAGKRTLVVRLGRAFARKQYLVSTQLAVLLPLLLLFYGYDWTLLIVPLFLSFPGLVLSVRLARCSPAYCNQLLAHSAMLLVAYAVVLSLAMIVA